MNSTELQKRFPEIYRDFFSKNDLVVSGCFSFPWWSRSAGTMTDQLILKSRIPLKCYVWVKKRKDSNILFQDFLSYSPSKNSFSSSSLPMITKNWERIIPLLQELLDNTSEWYDITVLSEIEKGHSFWFSGTFAAILSTVFHILSSNLTQETLRDYVAFCISSVFEKIFLLAWQIEFVLKDGNTIGQTIMTTLHNNADPSFYCSENFNPETTTLSDIKNIKYWYSSLEEKFQWSLITKEIPLDYYILFSWISANTKHIEQFKEFDKKSINHLKDFMLDEIFSKDMNELDIRPKKILETITPYSQMSDSLSVLNMMTISLFKKLFASWYNSGAAEEFIEHINRLRQFSSILEKQSSFADDFMSFFQKNRASLDEVIWIIPGYSGKLGGWYVVVTKPSISQSTFRKTIEDMQNQYPFIEIEYSSYIDGESNSGIIIEQYLSESKFSPYVWKNNVIYKNNFGELQMGEYRTLLEQASTWLLIDAIDRKIYYNGEKLTSKDIPSQSTTVDVLDILVENIGKDISNDQFPASSYIKNKNEMLGKIIIPLIRFVEEKTNTEFPLICKWSIGDFCLKLNSTDLRIWVIRKL